jgi:hypothetical protein
MGKCSASSRAESLGFLSAATLSLGAAEIIRDDWDAYEKALNDLNSDDWSLPFTV